MTEAAGAAGRTGEDGPLRSFGLLVGGVFALLGVWPAVARDAPPRLWALVLAVLLVGPAIVYPAALAPVRRVWMRLGHVLGWINTRLILMIAFYAMFAPVGLVRRWLGRDPMRLRREPEAETYRQSRRPRPASHMRHQF